jgi:Family of unknown function (DUF6350)
VRPQDDIPAGWLTQFRRGVFSGAGLLLLAVAGCAVPAFAAWLTPGADSSPASSAVKSGALLALSAAHGGVRLGGQAVTLVPLLVTAALCWLIASQARRSESWSSVVGLSVGYGIASGLLARWAEIGATRAPVLTSALFGTLLVGIVSACARGGAGCWRRLSERQRRVFRAGVAMLCCYLGAGALLVAGSLAMHLPTAIGMQRQLASGVAGLPIALIGIGVAPNAALAGAGYLAGPGFQVGSHTRISALSTSHGRLPSFPLLAAIPSGGPATVIGLLAMATVALLAGWLCVRLVRSAAAWPARLADVAAAAALAGGSLGLLTALGSGGIGSGALSAIGASWWAVGCCAGLLVLAGSTVWLLVDLLRARSSVASSTDAGSASPGSARAAAGTAVEPARARLRAVAGASADRANADQSTAERPAGDRRSDDDARADRSRNVG